MEYVIFVVGLLLGLLIMYILTRPKIMGVLKVYESTEYGEKPYLFVELSKPVEELRGRKHVCFDFSQN